MARRPVTTVIGPFCAAGHRRNAKNTDWVRTTIHGFVYQQARCKHCDSERNKKAYRRRVEARQMEAAE